MKKTITIIAAMLLFISISATAQTAYIPNIGGFISVINVATNTISATITINATECVSVSLDGTKVYVTNDGDSSVYVINTATNTVSDTIIVGSQPEGICVSLDGNKVYVANYLSNTVSVISTSTNTVSATIAVGTGPYGISVSPDGSKVYVANKGNNTVSVINTSTNTVSATITVGTQPYGVTVSPDGSKAYVTNFNNQSVSLINTATNTVTATISVGFNPMGIAVSPDGSKVYVANEASSTVSVINTTTNTVSNTISVGSTPQGISVSPDGSKVYVTNAVTTDISVINTSTNTVSTTIGISNSPFALGNFISTFTCISPTIPTISASVNPSCSGSPTVLSIVSGTLNNATNWQWYRGSCGGISVGSGTSITVSDTIATTYYVRGEGGCTGPGSCANITITVNPLPTATITPSGVTTFCQGDSVTLSVNINSSYLWSNNATTQSIIASSSGNYSVVVTGGNGCTVSSLPTSVTVNALPTLTVSSSDTISCINWSATSLFASPTGGTWSGSGINGNSFFSDSAGIGVHSIIYSYTDNNGCSNKDTLIMTVNICTGVNEITKNDAIIVYPNPANTTLNIHLSSYTQNEALLILDVFGQEVYSETFNKIDNIINVSKWNSGVYFYQIKNDKEIQQGKFIKE
jgi:YVTN family beta-propeller protein